MRALRFTLFLLPIFVVFAAKIAFAGTLVPVMIMDNGFRAEDNRIDSRFGAYYDEKLMRSILVPKAYADQTSVTLSAVPDYEDLITSNWKSAAIGHASKELIGHARLVAQALNERIGVFRSSEYPLIVVVDPRRQTTIEAVYNQGRAFSAYVAFTKKYFRSLDFIIKKQRVRIVVRSAFGIKVDAEFCKKMSFPPDCAAQFDSVFSDEFYRLIEENPQTAFVVAAGNNGKKILISDRPEEDALELPNVLVVGATDESGENLASDSDWHPRLVRIAASGVIMDASQNNRVERGTSFATPRVADALREFMFMHPEISSAAKAIDLFLEKRGQRMYRLKSKIASGRVLRTQSVTTEQPCGSSLLGDIIEGALNWWFIWY